jgi:hypothetical protein
VSLLNRYFVPVYARNGDYRPAKGDPAGTTLVPAAERAEYQRIYLEALRAKLSAGTVHAYVVAPSGHPIDSLHVADASKPARMLAMLEHAVEKLKVKAGEPLVKPCCQSREPAAPAGGLVLHLTARYLQRQGNDLVRIKSALGTERGGSWGALPSEDWIVLSPAECRKLLPAGAVRVGTSWDWDKEAAGRLLTHFYPPTENTDNRTNRLDDVAMKATVLSVKDGVVRARVEGRLKMKHPFYHKDTNEVVEARLIGLLEFEPGRSRVRSLRLITEQATYGCAANNRQAFGVAVYSLPAGHSK